MTIQWASAPRGASHVPTPKASLGQVDGSHISLVNVRVSPDFTSATSWSKNSDAPLGGEAGFHARAAVRPRVENRTGGRCLEGAERFRRRHP